MKKRLIYLFLPILFVVASIVYALFPKQEVIRLGVYSGSSWNVPNSRDNRIFDRVIQDFEEKYPQVQVIYESGIPKEDYSDWLSEAILQGKQPDVFMIPTDDFALLAEDGALKNLDIFLTKEMKDAFYPVSYQAGLYQGATYSLPFESNPIMMCVNKDLLEKEGIPLPQSSWTLDEFYAICQKVTRDTDEDGVIDQYGVTDYGWQEALAAYGGRLVTQEGVNINSPEMREALTFVSKLESLNQHYQVTSNDFDEGKVAFHPMTLAQYRTYKPYPYHVAKYSSFAWTCIQMPAKSTTINATQVGTSLFALSSKTKHVELAWELLSMLCQDESIQQNLFQKSQGMSVLKSVMETKTTEDILRADDFGSDSLTAATLNQLMTEAGNQNQVELSSKLIDKVDYLISRSLIEETVDKELPSIQKEIESENP